MLEGIDITAISQFCEQHYVESLSLFGSALTDDFDPQYSDYDFIVEFLDEIPSRARAWMGLKADLEIFLGHNVDLVIGHDLSNPYSAATVQGNMWELYTA